MLQIARRSMPLAFGIIIITATAAAQPPGPAKYETDLRERIATFEKAKRAADEKAVKAFDNLIEIAKSGPAIKEAARAELTEKSLKAKSQFITTWDWPDDPTYGLTKPEYDYNDELAKAFAPVSKGFEQTLKAYREANDTKAVSRLLDEKAKLVTTHFPARESFAVNTTWAGNRVGPKGSTSPFRMKLTVVKDFTFEAEVQQNPTTRDHPIYEVTGYMDGNKLLFSTATQKQGPPQKLTFSGYLSTGRLFLDIDGVTTKGKTIKDHAILEQVKKKK